MKVNLQEVIDIKHFGSFQIFKFLDFLMIQNKRY